MINENLLFYTITKSVICFKSLIMVLYYLNMREIEQNILLYYTAQ